MARHEADREDLMVEMAGVVRRVELKGLWRRGDADVQTDVFAGFRSQGWLTIYIGADPMYLFDEMGRLRRAFVDGCLFRTQGTTLARMIRERTETETILVRRDLSPTELQHFRDTMLTDIASVRNALQAETLRVSRLVPEKDDQLVKDLVIAIDAVLKATSFLAPAIVGKP